jgi:hypothetical protein
MFRNVMGYVFVVLFVPVGHGGRGIGGNRFVGFVHRQSK